MTAALIQHWLEAGRLDLPLPASGRTDERWRALALLAQDDIVAALARLKAHGVRLIDEHPRPGAHGSLVAFIHPASAHGVLVELKQKV